MNNLWSVIKFTYLSNIRMKSFKVMTIIFAILITLGISIPSIISKLSTDDTPDRIGVINTSPDVTAKLTDFYKNQPKPKLEIVALNDTGSQAGNDALGKEKIKAGDIKGYMVFTDEVVNGFPKVIYKSESTTMDSSVRQELQRGLEKLKTEVVLQNISKEQLAIIQSPVTLDTEQVKTNADAIGSSRTEKEMVTSFILVYAMLFLLYLSVITYGNMVATSVTQEKSSRVMELLITSSSPTKQMFGKIFGVCLLGLTQIAIFVIVVIVNLQLPFNSAVIGDLNLSISDLPIDMFIYFFIFYIGGFFLYAMIAAGIGSLVSRMEEVGQAVMPIMFLIMAAFFIAMFGLQSPNSTFVVAMSYVPFFSPLIMFLRVGVSNPAIWEVIISIVILFASIGLMGWLAAKIYRTGVLLYGKRPSFKELRKAMKAFK